MYFHSKQYLLLLLLALCTAVSAQKKEQNPLIYHLRFVNETNHGMLIIHRLLELYNQELNKHVDLDNYPLNNFSNADFKENIFEDQSRAYYEIAPFRLYDMALANEKLLPVSLAGELRADITAIKDIADQLEKKRYSTAALFQTADLEKMEGLRQVYESLENCVALYNQFQQLRDQVQAKFAAYNATKAKVGAGSVADNELFVQFGPWYVAANKLMAELKKENLSGVAALATNFSASTTNLTAVIQKNPQYLKLLLLKEIESKVSKFNVEVNNYVKGGKASASYSLYGDGYYYFNNRLTGISDKFGLGAVFKFNEWLEQTSLPYIGFSEMPHFYKVIYPKKKEIKVEALSKVIPKVIAAPTLEMPKIVEKRKIVERRDKKLNIDCDTLYIDVYDNQEYDKDTISLNFNGVWVLRQHELTKKPVTLALPMVPNKDNYLVLHAENLGIKPPNTAAIRYYQQSRTKPQVVVLNSNMQESEAILIRKVLSFNDKRSN